MTKLLFARGRLTAVGRGLLQDKPSLQGKVLVEQQAADPLSVHERRVIIRTMILSGALCGLAGYLIAAGLDHTITANSVGGRGFTGIMVAWLGKFNPIGMILTAALVQLLNQGAAQISRDFNVRGALPEVFVGIILFFVIASEFFINYQVRFRGQKKANRARMEGVK